MAEMFDKKLLIHRPGITITVKAYGTANRKPTVEFEQLEEKGVVRPRIYTTSIGITGEHFDELLAYLAQ